ncbi:MAG: hypothetical protein WCY29_13550 [Novosphingobium sp.]
MKNTYVVTELAGPRVAGRACVPNKTIELTEAEARFELIAGTIRKPEAASSDVEAERADWSDPVLDPPAEVARPRTRRK